jgi:outer membrane protein assembly factor BamE (lipoprotein component of BamABCDE complex)
MRIAIILAVMMLLASCGGNSGTKVDPSQAAQFKPGVTTYDQIIEALGPPNNLTQMSDGSKILVYVNTQTNVHGESFIPFAGMFVAGADVKQQTATFTFDQRGILKTSSTGQTQACSGGGVFNMNVSNANCQN